MNNNITEDYVSFEVAKLLKEKGFAWLDHTLVAKDGKPAWSNPTGVPTSLDNGYNCYEENGVPIRPRKYTPTNTHYPRPTHNVTIKWIRENFNWNIESGYRNSHKDYSSTIYPMFPNTQVHRTERFKTSEESVEAALLYTLQNLIP